MNNIQKEVGKRLKEARTKLNLKQIDVAEKAGIHSNYYAKVERGEVNASLETLQKISKALKIKSSDILPF